MSKLSDPHLTFSVARAVVLESMEFFRAQGQRNCEGVVLWPATLTGGTATVSSIIVPEQITSRLSFHIPQDETFNILAELAQRRQVIPIQVHSHPRDAFHSAADDELAFIKHEGAISIVVPNFGAFDDSEFMDRAAFHIMNADGQWTLIPNELIAPRFILL